MSEDRFIRRSDFEKMMKEIREIREYVFAQSVSKVSLKNKWVPSSVAMQLLDVKETKFRSLRNDGSIVWRYKQGNRGVEVLLKSIEDYKNRSSSHLLKKVA